MNSLGVIDDRDDMRETCVRAIDAVLEGRLGLIDHAPLEHLDGYPSWVIEQQIVALVVDERLSEQAGPGRTHVTYAGHDVIQILRQANPLLPLFVLTQYPDDIGLMEKRGAVEDVLSRRGFLHEPKLFVDRMVRAGQRYSTERTKAVAELGTLAARIASGKANESDTMRALALQIELNLNIPISEVGQRAAWIDALQRKVDEISSVRKALQIKLARAKK